MPEAISWSMERRGKSARIAELRAEYSASSVDKEGNLTLEVRLPQNGTSTKRDDVPSSRLRRGLRAIIGIAAMETCEVGIDVTVEIQSAGGFDDHAHVARAMQIANESFDGGRVASFRVVAERQNLATWLTAKAISGRVLVDKYLSIPTMER